jgi:hypothetical protein
VIDKTIVGEAFVNWKPLDLVEPAPCLFGSQSKFVQSLESKVGKRNC